MLTSAVTAYGDDEVRGIGRLHFPRPCRSIKIIKNANTENRFARKSIRVMVASKRFSHGRCAILRARHRESPAWMLLTAEAVANLFNDTRRPENNMTGDSRLTYARIGLT